MPEDVTGDERVLELRDEGRSFVAIAKKLQLSSAVDAISAFNRALERRDPTDQEALRTREVARLDALGERVKGRKDLSDEEIDRRLKGLVRLRKALHMA